MRSNRRSSLFAAALAVASTSAVCATTTETPAATRPASLAESGAAIEPEILRLREKINELLSHHTGKPLADIARDTDRDFYMSAEEARNYGLVDQVIMTQKEAKGAK